MLNSAEKTVLEWALYQTLGWDVESSEERYDHHRRQRGTRFSVADICTFTGLHRNSVNSALNLLQHFRLIEMKPIMAARWYYVRINLDVILAQNLGNSYQEVAQEMCKYRHKICATLGHNSHKKCATRALLIGRQRKTERDREHTSPSFLEFWTQYTSATGRAVNGVDERAAARSWEELAEEERGDALRAIPGVVDGRNADRYWLPQNYLANRIWTRAPQHRQYRPRTQPRGLKAGEIE